MLGSQPVIRNSDLLRFLSLLLAFILTGCSERSPLFALDYADRLARVVKESAPEPVPPARTGVPRRRDLQVSFQSYSIDLSNEVQAIEELLQSGFRPPYNVWRNQRWVLVADGRAAIKDHVEALEPLLQQCGFL